MQVLEWKGLFSFMPTWEIFEGDCVEVMKDIAPNSIDAIVTDPPAGISFMGKKWDSDKGGRDQWVTWMSGVALKCLILLKPGGHALVWALPRTSHWTATAWEDAGFEIRDCIYHIFGSGFPKGKYNLKPAAENWWLFRKPLSEKSVADNMKCWGTGALNIEDCRVPAPEGDRTEYGIDGNESAGRNRNAYSDHNAKRTPYVRPDNGRWPANVVLDEEAGRLLDEQSGVTTSGAMKREVGAYAGESTTKLLRGKSGPTNQHGDSGGASRFFYCTKASRKERGENNKHPTVKPLKLMRYLCRLIAPLGGTILDPFCGSGSTGVAAIDGGFNFIGIDQDPVCVDLTQERIENG